MPLSQKRIYAVVLAAGSASRYGSTKQLATLGGETLVYRAARLARGLCGERSLLVVGHEASEVHRAARGQCQFLAVNERFSEGLASSLSLAARVLDGAAEAIVLLLADQPRVSLEHLEALVERWDGASRSVAATAYGTALGAPALLPSGLFPDIAELTGDRGARALFDAPDVEVRSVACEAADLDVDTPQDLEALESSD